MTTNFERKWSELKEVFREYRSVIVNDVVKDRDGDLEIRRYYYGWGDADHGWEVHHNGYVSEFTVTGATPEEAVDKAIAEFKRLTEEQRAIIAREQREQAERYAAERGFVPGVRVELIEDPAFRGTYEGADDKGAIVSWDGIAPDGGSRWVRYTNVPGALAMLRVINEEVTHDQR